MTRKAKKINPDDERGVFEDLIFHTSQGDVTVRLAGLTQEQQYDKITEHMVKWGLLPDLRKLPTACQPEASPCAHARVSSLRTTTAIDLVQDQLAVSNGLALTAPRYSNKSSSENFLQDILKDY